MLSTQNRLKIQEILSRLSVGKEVTLSERVYLHKFADHDPSVAAWVHKARKHQKSGRSEDSLENLLNGLHLGPNDPEDEYKKEDDLGDWFSGAPSWLGRS